MNETYLRQTIPIIVSILFLIFHSFLFEKLVFGMGGNKIPTAIIVDADSGEPIEGAVAIAIWRKHSTKEAAWFEGGKMVPVKIEEAISDKEGKVYFEDFWDWHLLENRYPRLTVYKFGYVCWDQRQIFMPVDGSTIRKDFDEENRIVRMKKWPNDFSFNKHESFVSAVTGHGDLHDSLNKLFLQAFEKETMYRIRERNRKDSKRRIEKRRNK